ncbi:MAG: recombinase family protein [Rikenellaceae bacterium]|nr:recombinase family protein [Rikenellaceae bacterium]
MKKAVIYARVSSVGDRQSTFRQVADLTQYATTNGMAVTEIFEEHISGAVKNEERPVLCECLDYCIANGIHTLLISELSRLGRNVDEVLANVKRCKENNLNIYFQRENISIFQADGSKNPFLNIFISVLATCAEMEREAIAFRLNSGLKRYKENGGKVGRKVGSIKTKDKKQEEYAKVLRCLKQGKSIRDTSVLCGVSVSTVFRVKREFGV